MLHASSRPLATIPSTLDPRTVLVRRPGYRGCICTNAAPTGFYELTIDDRSQYGQRNANGEGRFVVLHNKEFKPYQVCRFSRLADMGLTPALASLRRIELPFQKCVVGHQGLRCYFQPGSLSWYCC
jgi:hypothetical protein